MTKTEELYQTLSSLDMPIAYQEFKQEQEPPYLAYFVDSEDSITADGEAILEVLHIEIHFITARARDLTQEQEIQDLLKSLKVAWQKDLDWDATQKIYDTIYSIELVEVEGE